MTTPNQERSVEEIVEEFNNKFTVPNNGTKMSSETVLNELITPKSISNWLTQTLTTNNQTTHDRLKAGIEGMHKDTENPPERHNYLGIGEVELMADIQGFAMDVAYNQALTDVLALVDEVYKSKD